jgi:hypothetical protein
MKHKPENAPSGIAGPERREPKEQAISHVPVLRPADTGTRLTLKEAVKECAPVAFAVQLRWSAQPIDLNSTPRDPIFGTYTLYTIRSRRNDREWFELRLGFFADAISAEQVAQYMRSEYDSAAVVPVNPKEKAALEASMSAARAVGHHTAPEVAATVASAAVTAAAAGTAAISRSSRLSGIGGSGAKLA